MIDLAGTETKALKVMEATLAVTVLVVFAALAFGLVYSHREDGKLHRQQIAGCERANQSRMYINELIRLTGSDLRPIAIPDCQQIIK